MKLIIRKPGSGTVKVTRAPKIVRPKEKPILDIRLFKGLKAVEAAMSNSVFERETETRGILLGIISGTSVFFYGEPGTAKSYQLNLVSKLMGLTTFDILLSESTKPESIFGPTDIPALAKGRQVVKTKGYAPTCEVLFLDEVFKANAIVLNPLLWLINERKFRNGDDGIQKCPLKVTFAASNEIPTDTTLAAMYDRLVLRYEVTSLKNRINIKKMINAHLENRRMDEIQPILDSQDVEEIMQACWKVVIPEGVHDVVCKIRDQLSISVPRLVISDRRLAAAFHIVQANALLNGRSVADVKDTSILSNIFWNSPEQQIKVRSIVLSHSDSNSVDLQSYVELAEDVWSKATQSGEIAKAEKKLAELYETTRKFTTESGKLVAERVLDKLTKAQEFLAARSNFILVRINSGGPITYKVSGASALSWTPTELRNAGFHWKRRASYWYCYGSTSKKKVDIQAFEVKLKDTIKEKMGVVARIKSL